MVPEQAGPGACGYFTSGKPVLTAILDGSAGWAPDPGPGGQLAQRRLLQGSIKAPWAGYVERLPAPAPLVGDTEMHVPWGEAPSLMGTSTIQ